MFSFVTWSLQFFGQGVSWGSGSEALCFGGPCLSASPEVKHNFLWLAVPNAEPPMPAFPDAVRDVYRTVPWKSLYSSVIASYSIRLYSQTLFESCGSLLAFL